MNIPAWREHATVFECDSDRLIGIVTRPERPIETGVVIIVGGPQYRAGSHRQFTLLARQLAEQGIASLRFDYRGMGDSEGDMRTFEDIDDDIRAAIDTFMTQASNIQQVMLWGFTRCRLGRALLWPYRPARPRPCPAQPLGPQRGGRGTRPAQALLSEPTAEQVVLGQIHSGQSKGWCFTWRFCPLHSPGQRAE